MKKRIAVMLCFLLILVMAGCGSSPSSKPGSNQPAGVNDVLQQGMAAADSQSAGTGQSTESTAPKQTDAETQASQTAEPSTEAVTSSAAESSADKVDVDLTVLSATMVYSEVYNMLSFPEQYIGKTIKMKGPFAYYHDEATDNYYFACIIQDATACCAQGIEFVLAGDHVFPDDYPAVSEEICVVGVFDTYQEGSYTYCTLRNAKLL